VFRRRRIALGGACALAVAAALGVGLAGADPSLKDQINSAQSNADQLSGRIDAQTQHVAQLELQARQAGARAMELSAQIDRAAQREKQLNDQLTAAEDQLNKARAQYHAAVVDLDRRLVAIYETDPPDYVSVLLNSDGFDDLSTRAAYLQALHDADLRVADRVAALRDQIAAHVNQIADLKQQVTEQARQLEASRADFTASQAAANRESAAVAQARASTQSSLAGVQGKVSDLEQQLAGQQGGPAFLGGPYSIPTYIVMCESGGNYHALNSSSGAGGAYQILPSTWRAYGGQGAPQNAPKAVQDRIAAEIWRDSGPSAWACA
jgi:septal ring factor EnvC (AmiA/AmiB activator)